MSSLDDDVGDGHLTFTIRKDRQTMTVLQATRTRGSSGATRSGRLFLLELSGNCIHQRPVSPDLLTFIRRQEAHPGCRAQPSQVHDAR
jgi:hypothetical protein